MFVKKPFQKQTYSPSEDHNWSYQKRNIQRGLMREFKLSYNAGEANKNICCLKGESELDYSIVTRWLKKFLLCCKDTDDQARSGRPKSVDSDAILKAVEANPVSVIWRVSGEISIVQFDVVRQLHDLGKNIRCCRKISLITKILQNIWHYQIF